MVFLGGWTGRGIRIYALGSMTLHGWKRWASDCLSWVRAGVVLGGFVALGAPAQSTGFLPEAKALFGACSAHADGSVGRTYACPGFNATIAWLEVPSEYSDEKVLEVMRGGIAAAAKGGLESKAATLTLAGREHTALEMTVRVPEAGETRGFLTVEREATGLWSFMCLADSRQKAASANCLKVLEYFASKKVPEPLDLKAPAPLTKAMLGARELVVPDGCSLSPSTVPEVGRIDCPGSFLSWTRVTLEVDLDQWFQRQKKSLGPSFRQMVTEKKGVMTERPVDCRVVGQPGMCHQYRVPLDRNQGELRLLLAVASMGKVTVQLVCSHSGRSEAFPPVCNGLLELLPAQSPKAGPDDAGPVAKPE
ncbi:hypothetical protein MFUL124B02_24490 [Myxococcus fulvus 124B02]|nr:hypothetical protein MFUL124B02_24490 [Myxococcus fulvus 124B02]